MKKTYFTIICITLVAFVFFSCNNDDRCENSIIKTESLENLYGCTDTRYSLDIKLSENYTIIRNQQAFLDLTTGTCRPDIDFKSYDLIIGKKGLGSGNSSIEYKLVEDCKKTTKKLTVIFKQNISAVAPNITYHILIPKLQETETVSVDTELKYLY